MATTTTSTTTTTIAPPVTLPPLRPRPALRRPLRRRRPQADYYYDEEDYEDDYVEEPRSRRRKPAVRPRTRRPEYDDYGGQGRRYSDDTYNKRPSFTRDRVRDEYDYEEPAPVAPPTRKRNRPSGEARPAAAENRRPDDRNERRRNQNDERYNSERRTPTDRRPANRKRPAGNDQRRPMFDDEPIVNRPMGKKNARPQQYEEDEYDDADYAPAKQAPIEDDTTKVRPSGSGASIYSRPRAPPKINRPVPINDKKKFEYMPKAPATTAAAYVDDEDYDYDAPVAAAAPPPPPRPLLNEKSESKYVNQRVRVPRPQQREQREPLFQEDDDPGVRGNYKYIYNKHDTRASNNSKEETVDARQASEPTAAADEEEIIADDEEEEAARPPTPPPRPPPKIKSSYNNYTPADGTSLSRPAAFIPRTTSEIPNVYKKFRNNVRSIGREPTTERPVDITSEEQFDNNDEGIDTRKSHRPVDKQPEYLPFKTKYHRFASSKDVRNSDLMSRVAADLRGDDVGEADDEFDDKMDADLLPPPPPPPPSSVQTPSTPKTVTEKFEETSEKRPVVRVVKRPFLPSRGGNPYLPRGLKPVGGGADKETVVVTEHVPVAETVGPPTIDGPLLIYNNPPLTREKTETEDVSISSTTLEQPQPGSSPLQPHQIESPRTTLEKIYNSEYDVTLNDALNPTLKPLTPSRSSPIGFSLSNRYYPENAYAADISLAPSSQQVYAQAKSGSVAGGVHEYYDDYEY